jgi:glycosyltransferase involved in cell wall biosynthesis
MGPPKAIRGIHVLLKAFDLAAAQMENVTLVCLIRGGAEDELAAMERILKSLQQKGRVLAIKESLNRADIAAFTSACHAVVLPFLVVPSEIPLTVLEVLALGKPILVSKTGGTSEYVGDAGMVFPAGNAKALKNALIKTCNDREFYSRMCLAAKDKGKRQPTWQGVAEEFLKFVVPIVSNFQESSHIR